MKKKKLRVVIDTNLFVSGLIIPQRTPYQLIKEWRKKLFILVTSEKLIRELEEVLKRPEFAKLISNNIAEILIRSIRKYAQITTPIGDLPITVRGPKDERVLATAFSGYANYLITGDKDLLVLKNNLHIKPLKIVTASEFLNELQKK